MGTCGHLGTGKGGLYGAQSGSKGLNICVTLDNNEIVHCHKENALRTGVIQFGTLILFLFLFYQQKTPDVSSVIVFLQNTSQYLNL